MNLFSTGDRGVTGETVDLERDLHVVPEHLLLLPAQRRHVEGNNFISPVSVNVIKNYRKLISAIIYSLEMS